MSEPTVHIVTDLPAKKKPFYLRKTYVAAAVTTAVVAGAVYAYKKGLFEDTSVVIDSTENALTITAA